VARPRRPREEELARAHALVEELAALRARLRRVGAAPTQAELIARLRKREPRWGSARTCLRLLRLARESTEAEWQAAEHELHLRKAMLRVAKHFAVTPKQREMLRSLRVPPDIARRLGFDRLLAVWRRQLLAVWHRRK
jgi:hypothetical protein